jgi:hypothetical protein
MTIIENADLKVTLTVYADDTPGLATLLREVAREVRLGSLAGNGGGCIGSYVYSVEDQTRALELRRATDGGLIPLPEIGTGDKDGAYCSHDWSYPPEICPVCNLPVPPKPRLTDKQGGGYA